MGSTIREHPRRIGSTRAFGRRLNQSGSADLPEACPCRQPEEQILRDCGRFGNTAHCTLDRRLSQWPHRSCLLERRGQDSPSA